MNILERLTGQQLAPLLIESKHAFLPGKKNPDETAISLNEKFKNDKKYNVFGYIISGKAVSYITALSGRTDDEIAIGPMYVSKSFRGKGLGKQQILDFIHLYTKQGYESIYTKTWSGNTASRHSFEAIGFTEESRTDDDRVNGDSTVSFIKTRQQ